MTRSRKEKKASLKKEKKRSHKVTLNTSIIANRGIMPEITTQNRNKTKKPERESKPQIKNESLNRKNIREKSKIKPEKT
jgi:hypothetical protein